jgi:hypothetical protein
MFVKFSKFKKGIDVYTNIQCHCFPNVFGIDAVLERPWECVARRIAFKKNNMIYNYPCSFISSEEYLGISGLPTQLGYGIADTGINFGRTGSETLGRTGLLLRSRDHLLRVSARLNHKNNSDHCSKGNHKGQENHYPLGFAENVEAAFYPRPFGWLLLSAGALLLGLWVIDTVTIPFFCGEGRRVGLVSILLWRLLLPAFLWTIWHALSLLRYSVILN